MRRPIQALVLASVLIAACGNGGIAGCAYDFDAPFEASPLHWGDAATGGTAGALDAETEGGAGADAGLDASAGGTGGTAGVGGTGGAAGSTGGVGGTGGSDTGGTGAASGTGGATGGTGGTAGTAGTGGTGGTGGVGGMGGTSGTGGATGGTGGTAGTGGTGGTSGTGGATGGTGGTAGTGGASGTGGATGGTGGGTGGSTTTVAGHACTLTNPNGTGDEPDGIIPVCCAPSSGEEDDAQDLFTRLNAHRVANGRSTLTYDENLEATIQAHLLHQSLHPFTSWTAPESVVETLGDRAALCGTSTSGGVFVMYVTSASAAMTQWKNNAAYNDMLLSTAHTRVGGGRYQTQWALQFGP